MYALGGTVTTSGDRRIHSFTSTANLTVLAPGICDVLVVGGGGGGGAGSCCVAYPAGGAGGIVTYSTKVWVGAGTVVCTVGAAGGYHDPDVPGYNGGNSSFGTYVTATGGGGAQLYGTGGSNASYSGGVKSGYGSGGGAGSAANGTNGPTGNGGAATSNSITGSAVAYASGGAGWEGGPLGNTPTCSYGGGGTGDGHATRASQAGIVIISYTPSAPWIPRALYTPGFFISPEGTLSLAGALTNFSELHPALAGTLSLAGELIKDTTKTFDGALSLAGETIKGWTRTFEGNLSISGSAIKDWARIFAGTLGLSGATSGTNIVGIVRRIFGTPNPSVQVISGKRE